MCFCLPILTFTISPHLGNSSCYITHQVSTIASLPQRTKTGQRTVSTSAVLAWLNQRLCVLRGLQCHIDGLCPLDTSSTLPTTNRTHQTSSSDIVKWRLTRNMETSHSHGNYTVGYHTVGYNSHGCEKFPHIQSQLHPAESPDGFCESHGPFHC